MLSNLDAVYGLDQRMTIGEIYGCTSNINGDWRGWVAYKGDELHITIPGVWADEGTTVSFDETNKVHRFTVHYPHGTPGGLKIIPIPQDVGYQEYAVYQIYVDNRPCPTYAFMSNSAAEPIELLPSFSNGSLSGAGDFNLVINDTKKLAEQFNQPIISGTRWMTKNWFNDTPEGIFYTYAQYRHTSFEFYLTAQASGGSSSRQKDYLEWAIYVDNTWVPFWSLYLELNGSNSPTEPIRIRLIDLFSLTLNRWYPFRFTHRLGENSRGDGIARVFWYGQQRNSTAALWTQQNRWELGDVVDGNGTGNPRLDIMNDNLTYLNSRRNSVNQVMRQATNNRDDDDLGHYNNPVFARRVHRWLAYENASLDDPDTTANEGEATLFYSVGKPDIFASVNITKTFVTAYLDLDTTPIKPGMMFYAYNCKYAIQVPDHP